MSNLKKFGDALLKYALSPAILIGALWYFATYIEGAKERQFDNPEDKYRTKMHIDNAPSPEQEQRAYILDSINKTHAIQSRKHRDSVLDAILIKQNNNDNNLKI